MNKTLNMWRYLKEAVGSKKDCHNFKSININDTMFETDIANVLNRYFVEM